MTRTCILALPILMALTACSSQLPTVEQEGPYHAIAGTTAGWGDGQAEIVHETEINDLQIRLVRLKTKNCTQGFDEHLELNGPIDADSTFVTANTCSN